MDQHELLPRNQFEPEKTDWQNKDMVLLQQKLWSLLARRSRLYTMDDSSSLRIETAQELFSSLCFLLERSLQKHGLDTKALLTADLEETLAQGIRLVEEELEKGKALLQTVQLHLPALENRYLEATLADMTRFFLRYDRHYFAHQIPCEIDYQLCHAVPESLLGILYINEYLTRLLMESRFLRCFEVGTVKGLLAAYYPGYWSVPLNLYEPVLINGLGRALLDGRISQLTVSGKEKEELLRRLSPLRQEERRALLLQGAAILSRQLCINEPREKQYLSLAVRNLYPRLETGLEMQQLDGIFLSF